MDVNQCASFPGFPCLNGSTCVDGVFSFGCECPAGWAGYKWEVDVNACKSSPCKNGTTCSDSSQKQSTSIDRYTCSCVAGFADAICETDVAECASSPWLHRATWHGGTTCT